MKCNSFFSELSGSPSDGELASLLQLLPDQAELVEFYRKQDGGTLNAPEIGAEFWPISEILETRTSGNMGWPNCYLFFGGNGGGEFLGLRLGQSDEHYFSTQGIADEGDISDLGSFETMVHRVAAGGIF